MPTASALKEFAANSLRHDSPQLVRLQAVGMGHVVIGTARVAARPALPSVGGLAGVRKIVGD